MRAPGVLLLLVVGCADRDVRPRWRDTREVCDWRSSDPGSRLGQRAPPLTLDCVEQVLGDFSVDVDAFVEADGVTPEDLVDHPDTLDSRLGSVVTAAWALHTSSLGDKREMVEAEVNIPARRRLATVAWRHRHRLMQAALYDWTAGHIRDVVPAETGTGDAGFVPGWRRVELVHPAPYLPGAALLVHEARHAEGPDHVPCPHDPLTECDEGRTGSYGFQLDVLELARRRARLPQHRDVIVRHMRSLEDHIVPVSSDTRSARR